VPHQRHMCKIAQSTIAPQMWSRLQTQDY